MPASARSLVPKLAFFISLLGGHYKCHSVRLRWYQVMASRVPRPPFSMSNIGDIGYQAVQSGQYRAAPRPRTVQETTLPLGLE